MANTVTIIPQAVGVKDCIHLTLFSPSGEEETSRIIYDPALYHSDFGVKTKIRWVMASVASATAFIRLLWEADTNVTAVSIPAFACTILDFQNHVLCGINPPAVSGLTGRILLTTTGLATDDSFTMSFIVEAATK